MMTTERRTILKGSGLNAALPRDVCGNHGGDGIRLQTQKKEIKSHFCKKKKKKSIYNHMIEIKSNKQVHNCVNKYASMYVIMEISTQVHKYS